MRIPKAPPHPIPYQGSKRRLADRILAEVGARRFDTVFEPFAGSAAISLACASRGVASSYSISDSLEPLVEIWNRILGRPAELADEYEQVWLDQLDDPRTHYNAVRDRFNSAGGAAELLYLLARCVKNSPRFNGDGHFNQSPDHRRLGMRPEKMRREILGASTLLAGRSKASSCDFEVALRSATPSDLVYMDPPWQGTSEGVDKRYRDWLSRDRLVGVLEDLARRGVPFILSYDGRHGSKTYGEPLPTSIGARLVELDAGRSSQATLNGRDTRTIESLYVSESLDFVEEAFVQQALISASV